MNISYDVYEVSDEPKAFATFYFVHAYFASCNQFHLKCVNLFLSSKSPVNSPGLIGMYDTSRVHLHRLINSEHAPVVM